MAVSTSPQRQQGALLALRAGEQQRECFMSNSIPSGSRRSPAAKTQPLDPWAAFLSYLIPGLGQIYQGRVAKGLLFCVALYTLFGYGMYLGHGMNVYLPDETKLPRIFLISKGNVVLTDGLELKGVFAAVGHRIHFLGQMWIGVAAWPAVWQYLNFDETKESLPLIGSFERTPAEAIVNQIQNEDDKTWDLGWVFTVIAGVLNIMVIYDALAGPAFGTVESTARDSEVRHGNAVVGASP
jgi:TM2 domain-containing membrane protein YozV